MEAIAIRLEASASRLEAVAIRLVATLVERWSSDDIVQDMLFAAFNHVNPSVSKVVLHPSGPLPG